MKRAKTRKPASADAVRTAERGATGLVKPLPHLARIQRAFGPGRDLDSVRSHDQPHSTLAARELGVLGYTVGDRVVFSAPPTLRTAAHEAAHVIQQRAGATTATHVMGEDLEQEAERVAEEVERGASVAHLLPTPGDRRAPRGRVPQFRVEDARDDAAAIRIAAHELIEQYASDADGLAATIISHLTLPGDRFEDWDRVPIAAEALRLTRNPKALGGAIAKQLTDDRVSALKATDPQAVTMLASAVSRGGLHREAERIMRIVVGAAHGHLFGETASATPEIRGALQQHDAQLQSVAEGSEPVVFDEYEIVMDGMPAKLSPEQYLTELSEDLNAAVRDDTFDSVNVFKRVQKSARRTKPAIGDVYDIDIFGPDNGSVMLVERTPTHFIFQTVWTSSTGSHPEYGSREFGFERLERGGIRWYTRGASRPGSAAATIAGGPIQKKGWTALVHGIANRLASRGGKVRAGSFGFRIQRL